MVRRAYLYIFIAARALIEQINLQFHRLFKDLNHYCILIEAFQRLI